MIAHTPIRNCAFAAIDFESAGAASGRTDVPIQIGMAAWSPDAGMEKSFVSYLRGTQGIAWSAQKVHGITLLDLQEAPELLTLWPVVKEHLGGRVVVAHGKGTEKKFLRAFPGHGFGPWIDTLLLARATWPQWQDHSLSVLCDSLELTALVNAACPGRRWHDALFDATASLFLLEKILQLTQSWHVPLGHFLQPDQSAWHRHQPNRG
jgi:DNA polymerase-3 subunit epsilon